MTDSQPTHSRLRGFALHVLPALVYAAGIFYAGSIASSALPRVTMADKAAHLLAFAIMQMLAFRAIRFQWPRLGLKLHLLASMVATSAIGAVLEIYQLFLRYRAAEVFDWVADTIGALVAGGILFLLLKGTREGEPPAQLHQRDSTSAAG